ncbi:ATP-dependent DNA helicase Q4 isoform X2 [Polypterus senegalus]|uniref:ATP-dependent DNA helicase Q4 isoform X2 n=1 Tax=Polypterus senegalus TaxID=55291 RepID=UPI001962B775|nr:ATP-dependent DNA helicase Q4 isoform X2 [Polypterus senegalus]
MMDRYNDLKILLKKWESSFVQEHKRKPNKEDIDSASQETKELYREYRALKTTRENAENEKMTASNSGISKQDDVIADSGCWGSHLNRVNTPSTKLTSKERDSLKVSALYYGMKLKSNMGTLTKDRPTSLKKSFTPKRTLKKSPEKTTNTATVESPPLCVPNPSICTTPLSCSRVPSLSTEEEDQPFQGLNVAKIISPVTCTKNEVKAQRLRNSMIKRLSSLDPGWLERCRVFAKVEQEDEMPIRNMANGNLNAEYSKKNNLPNHLVMSSKEDAVDPEMLKELVCSLNSTETKQKEGSVNGFQKTPSDHKTEKVTKSKYVENMHQYEFNEDEHPLSTDSKQNSGNAEFEQKTQETQKIGKEIHSGVASEAEQPRKEIRKINKKRQRAEETVNSLEPTSVPKKRKTTKGSPVSTVGEKCGKPKAGRRCGSKEVTEESSSAQNLKPDQTHSIENIFGELEDEAEAMRNTNTHASRGRRLGSKPTDGNFVRINLKKKSHVKGFALKGALLRKQMYMHKFQLKGERFGGAGRGRGRGFVSSGDICFKCGGTGHWARDCKGRVPVVQLEEPDENAEEAFELPTLEEVARTTATLRCDPFVPAHSSQENESEMKEEDYVLMNVIRPDYEKPTPPEAIKPLYHLEEDGKVIATPPEVYEALADFGYKSFRPGQELAIMRILSGLSTLVVLSTGMGKSLCYQLPAYLYAKRSKSIALVVSPLVSLMDDQVSGLPPKVKAACIHSNMTKNQREAAIEKVKEGKVHVLLLSPEALVGGGHAGSGCLPPADQLPPVSFACIDEAHCVSEWSHNFRPCYLRLCKVLRDRLGVRCLLGLTATATLATARDIAHHLEIKDEDGIAVRSAAVPPNLHLSVSMDKEKDQALVGLLKGDRFGSLDSIIVYCTRREETNRIAALLRTCMQGVVLKEVPESIEEEFEDIHAKRKKALAKKMIRKPLKWIAESYHAGMSASQRRRVQNNFMCGELRIVVATVAFGMGLDKSDVRGIIHYNMPKSFESYVQEIGRAGRDGKSAHCHLFLDPEGGDLCELRRHIYGDTVDYFTVKKLVQKLFPPCKCRQINEKQQALLKFGEVEDEEMLSLPDPSNGQSPSSVHQHQEEEQNCSETQNVIRVCHTHERAVPIQETVEALDITEEGIETMLCYLELHPQHWVELLHPTLSSCHLVCYSGPQQLRAIAKICPPVAVALARKRLAGESLSHSSSVTFDVVELADSMGWELIPVKRTLRQLQWKTERGPPGFRGTGKSGVLVEFSSLSFHFRSYGDLTHQEMDSICEFLHQRIQAQEKTQLYQLKACFKAFFSVAYRSSTSCSDKMDDDRSQKLKALLMNYFDKKAELDLSKKYEEDKEDCELSKYKLKDWEDQIRADIRSFLSTHNEEKFSGRAIARIFHGIGSPCYPALTYGKDRRFWRKYINFDFNEIIRMATEEIIRTK